MEEEATAIDGPLWLVLFCSCIETGGFLFWSKFIKGPLGFEHPAATFCFGILALLSQFPLWFLDVSTEKRAI